MRADVHGSSEVFILFDLNQILSTSSAHLPLKSIDEHDLFFDSPFGAAVNFISVVGQADVVKASKLNSLVRCTSLD
jgi:hypothetical protein